MKWQLDIWIRKMIRKRYLGHGSYTAFEAGVKYRLNGRSMEKNPYQRSDCIRAFDIGWYEADRAYAEGIELECPYCGRVIPDRLKVVPE